MVSTGAIGPSVHPPDEAPAGLSLSSQRVRLMLITSTQRSVPRSCWVVFFFPLSLLDRNLETSMRIHFHRHHHHSVSILAQERLKRRLRVASCTCVSSVLGPTEALRMTWSCPVCTANRDHRRKCSARDCRYPGGPASAWQNSGKDTWNNKSASVPAMSRRWTCRACSYENYSWRAFCHGCNQAAESAGRGGNGGASTRRPAQRGMQRGSWGGCDAGRGGRCCQIRGAGAREGLGREHRQSREGSRWQARRCHRRGPTAEEAGAASPASRPWLSSGRQLARGKRRSSSSRVCRRRRSTSHSSCF